MKIILTFVLSFYTVCIYSQINSGEYDSDLMIAFNPKNKLITGYFASYSGYDESTSNPKFSCIFYINGLLNEKETKIETYHPLSSDNKITGSLKVNDSNFISISLTEEHGGCWNVFHFADGFADFKIARKTSWLEIRFVTSNKSFFYKDKSDNSKSKAYLVKGDVIYIDKIDDNWVHCKYIGKNITEGWIKKETINK